jgi:tetratricopeptide (TPR) repeat protein
MNATEASNGNQSVLVATAYILESWQRYPDAIRIYEELVEDNPLNLRFHSNLAWSYYQSGNYQKAVDILYDAIKMNTGAQEYDNGHLKGMLMNDMNAIISLHKEQLDISTIPAALIKSLPVDMRIVIECNKDNLGNIRITEPGNYVCTYSNPVTKNGGVIQKGHYWYYDHPFEYQIKHSRPGKYKISVDHYDYRSYLRIPSVIRIRKFKNFGMKNQSIEVETVMMDNQFGEIEIHEIRWDEK